VTLVDEIREGCAWVAERATRVRIVDEAVPAYAAALPAPGGEADAPLVEGPPELLAAFHLTLDAINFGSGWFPTLRKREGRSGYWTVALGLRDRFAQHGAWPAAALRELDAGTIAAALGQHPEHELMALFALAERPRSARHRRARRQLPHARTQRRPLGGRARRAARRLGLLRRRLALRRTHRPVLQARTDRGLGPP
jgi:hypothetical protein